jgi:phospholipid/cholesterol/gamma-HCH transport system substrate-binding protein
VADSKYSALRVGLLILAGIAIIAVAIFSIGTGTRLLTGSEVFEAHFHRTNGLQTGAPVSLSGVNIGAVESIKFPMDPTANYVVVKMWVEASAAQRVRTDSVATINTMGLLGDKFLELTPGTPAAPVAEPSSVLKSEDPIDYEALLRRPGTGDFIANVMASTNSLRSILEDIDKGNGLLGQLIRGSKGKEKQLTLASINESLDRMNRLTAELNKTAERINRGQGLAGALLSSRTNGRRVVADISSTAASLRATSSRLDELTARLDKAQGMLPRLVEDRNYANQVLAKMQRSSDDLEQILHKINSGQGTLGAMVNDPSLYDEAKAVLGGGGWGTSILRGLYSVTHPFSTSGSEPGTTATTTTSENGASAPSSANGATAVSSQASPSSSTGPPHQ